MANPADELGPGDVADTIARIEGIYRDRVALRRFWESLPLSRLFRSLDASTAEAPSNPPAEEA